MRINSEGIVALGDSLGAVADLLETGALATRDDQRDTYGFIDVSAAGALDDVRGDYELARIALCEQLHQLDTLARQAGGCYVAAEQSAQRGFEVSR